MRCYANMQLICCTEMLCILLCPELYIKVILDDKRDNVGKRAVYTSLSGSLIVSFLTYTYNLHQKTLKTSIPKYGKS